MPYSPTVAVVATLLAAAYAVGRGCCPRLQAARSLAALPLRVGAPADGSVGGVALAGDAAPASAAASMGSSAHEATPAGGAVPQGGRPCEGVSPAGAAVAGASPRGRSDHRHLCSRAANPIGSKPTASKLPAGCYRRNSYAACLRLRYTHVDRG
ncbi:uncharacterized protein LOC135677493 [Musa acuminata AAA Group]|uniref:uncharacterized protein LOC135677493 n=1 Tax=Musa acuminata AAA Group TaxID=214697 RepID=UPI0031CEA834